MPTPNTDVSSDAKRPQKKKKGRKNRDSDD
jgi:hypothetical protein